LEYNAITFLLPDKRKQAIIFEIQLGIPEPINNYINEKNIWKSTMALVDTGATGSCISRRFATNAQLKPIKLGTVIGAHGIAIVPVYQIDILLPNGIYFTNMEVAEFYGNINFDFIIGMNILRMGDMALTNAQGKTVFSFRIPPAEEHIDFIIKK